MARWTIIFFALVVGLAAGDVEVIDVPTAPPLPSMTVPTLPAVEMPDMPTTPALVVTDADMPTVPPVEPVELPAVSTNPTTEKDLPGAASDQGGEADASDAFNAGFTKTSKQNQQYAVIQWILIAIFGVIYKFKVVDEYPDKVEANERSRELQGENEVMAIFNNCFSANCMLSWCCLAPRAAHTFDKTGVIPYWVGLVAMLCCPCVTLCYTNACTDMNEDLGGEKRNCCMAAFCAWCCACCVVLQDAESLDAATGTRTGCLSVEQMERGDSSAEE